MKNYFLLLFTGRYYYYDKIGLLFLVFFGTANFLFLRFEKVISQDPCVPINFENSDQMTEFLNLYPYGNTAEFKSLNFPKQLCYSWMVPKSYGLILEFVKMSYDFCANMNLSQNELEDVLTRTINGLFTDCLNPNLVVWIRKNPENLPCLTQICINLDEFENLCGHLDHYLHLNLLKFNVMEQELGQEQPTLNEDQTDEQQSDHVFNGNVPKSMDKDTNSLSTDLIKLRPAKNRRLASVVNRISQMVSLYVFWHFVT